MREMMTVDPGIEPTVQRVQPFLYKPAPDELQHTPNTELHTQKFCAANTVGMTSVIYWGMSRVWWFFRPCGLSKSD